MIKKKEKCIVNESREIQLAMSLIKNGARLQLLEMETSLSRDRLIRLYKELQGVSPPKGMLPFSTDWFLTWQPNIHASFFLLIYRQLETYAGLKGIEAVSKAYQIYLEQMPPEPAQEAVLSLTRAWTLIRFLKSGMLSTTDCKKCSGVFIVRPRGGHRYVCGLCHMPSRAGKTRKVLDAASLAAQSED
jgi:flagellar transcriptional activator FlhC